MSENNVSTTAHEGMCDYDFPSLANVVKYHFDGSIKANGWLFTTDAEGLYDAYLANIPEGYRQQHTCHCCRSFINRFGSLVCINEHAGTYSPIWDSDSVSSFYKPAIEAMAKIVNKAKVTGVFLSSKETLGTPQTAIDYVSSWYHFNVKITNQMIHNKRNVLTSGQAMALKRENFKSVKKALAEFPKALLDSALSLLEQEKLNRSEKFVGPVKWLRVLQDRPKGLKGDNLVWKAIAMAPEGYCHPRTSVVGSLLEDIEKRLDFDLISARFATKTSGENYQRSKTAPTEGNIRAAESIVEKLGIARSFVRRFATIEDIKVVMWKPEESKKKPSDGIFSHLTAKNAKDNDYSVMSNDTMLITWEKFARTVLAKATALQLRTPTIGHYTGLTTAVHADAPPILKWDLEEERNPVSWYVYTKGSNPRIWNLPLNEWVDVNLVTPHPTLWGTKPKPHLAEGVILILNGAIDNERPQACIFPEILKDDLHAIRKTIEAHSNSMHLSGKEMGNACGYSIRKGANDPVIVRAKLNNTWTQYKIDRWD